MPQILEPPIFGPYLEIQKLTIAVETSLGGLCMKIHDVRLRYIKEILTFYLPILMG